MPLNELYVNGRRVYVLVVLGGAMLATVAGYVNAVMLGLLSVPVSHMSGAVSHLSMDAAAHDGLRVQQGAAVVAAFVLGAALSGALIGGQRLRPGRSYGVVLIGEGCVLLLASVLAMRGWMIAAPAAAALACGLQNAMASSFHGLVVRTTHVTGIVTDLGVMLGHLVRRHRVRAADAILLASLLVGFFLGGGVGWLAETQLGPGAVAMAAPPCFLGGLGYYLWRIGHFRWLH